MLVPLVGAPILEIAVIFQQMWVMVEEGGTWPNNGALPAAESGKGFYATMNCPWFGVLLCILLTMYNLQRCYLWYFKIDNYPDPCMFRACKEKWEEEFGSTLDPSSTLQTGRGTERVELA